MDFVSPHIERYLHAQQPAPEPVLAAMQAEGEARRFPIIGPLVGRLCEQWARAVGARRVFELGSGFGYSTAWFARAVGAGGTVIHTENDPGLSDEARRWIAKARLTRRVDFRLGDAVDVLRVDKALNDVVFCDIDKEGYPDAWKVARQRVRVGGLVITDNTLWHGKVTKAAKDAATEAVQEYNRLAGSDPRFLTTILPVRDGVSVSLRLK